MSVVIVNYNMGNLGSIANMVKKIGKTAKITADKEEIGAASKLILPGVGAFDNGMKNLEELGLIELLGKKVLEEKIPVLGICLGMQLLSQGSEEGKLSGLSWIRGKAVKFIDNQNPLDGQKLRIPHMGWNSVIVKKKSHLFDDMYDDPSFYFVHSYHVACEDPSDVLTNTIYGEQFTSSVERDNIFGVQFHPEKSHKYGMKLLANFLNL